MERTHADVLVGMHFHEITDAPQDFFEILPIEWQQDITDQWLEIESYLRVFIIENENGPQAGGLVFDQMPPDMRLHTHACQQWVDKGFFYLGYIWVNESYRSRKLGSQWISYLRNHYPGQNFWLSIEDIELLPFYEKNGFFVADVLHTPAGMEWVLVDGPIPMKPCV